MTIQTVTITNWLPSMNANGSVGHPMARNRIKKQDMGTVWGACKYAGWQRFDGKVRVTIILYFAQRRRRDMDNLYYRVKGAVDGIKEFCVDDSSEWMELVVTEQLTLPATHKGIRKATKITMETLA